MALWSTLGDLMLGSEWPESLKNAGIVNPLAAGMCLLKAVNVKRPRYAHQDTTAGLDISRKKSLHQQWNIFIFRRMEQYSTFKFWSPVLNYQRGIFLFIRKNGERKINLMISVLKELMHLFFAFVLLFFVFDN